VVKINSGFATSTAPKVVTNTEATFSFPKASPNSKHPNTADAKTLVLEIAIVSPAGQSKKVANTANASAKTLEMPLANSQTRWLGLVGH